MVGNGTMAAINEDFEAKLQFLTEVLPGVPVADLQKRLQMWALTHTIRLFDRLTCIVDSALDTNQTVDHVINELMNSQDCHPAPEKKSEKIEIDLVSYEPIRWGNDKAVEDDVSSQ